MRQGRQASAIARLIAFRCHRSTCSKPCPQSSWTSPSSIWYRRVNSPHLSKTRGFPPPAHAGFDLIEFFRPLPTRERALPQRAGARAFELGLGRGYAGSFLDHYKTQEFVLLPNLWSNEFLQIPEAPLAV